MFLAALIGVALLVGVPIRTLLLSGYASGRKKRAQTPDAAPPPNGKGHRTEAQKNPLLRSFLWAVLLMPLLILIGLLGPGCSYRSWNKGGETGSTQPGPGRSAIFPKAINGRAPSPIFPVHPWIPVTETGFSFR